MPLDLVQNGDTGLDARTKINAGLSKADANETALGSKVGVVTLDTSDPRTDGFTAVIDSEGVAPDGTRWKKVGPTDNDWEQIMVSKNGGFTANIVASPVETQVPAQGSIGLKNNTLAVGDGETLGGHGMAPEAEVAYGVGAQFRRDETAGYTNAVNFAAMSNTQVAVNILSTTGYARGVNCDGSLTAVLTTTAPYNTLIFAAPSAAYSTNALKFYALYPCTAGGIPDASGQITHFGPEAIGYDSPKICTLDLGRDNSAYTQILLTDQPLSFLDLSGQTDKALTLLNIIGTNIQNLDLSGFTLLDTVAAQDSALNRINVSGCTALRNLSLQNTELRQLDASNLPTLSLLRADNSDLHYLNVANTPVLDSIQVYNNPNLTSIDLATTASLTVLRAYGCGLTELTNLPASLTQLLIANNPDLTTVDVSGLVSVTYIDCGFCDIAVLDLVNCVALRNLDAQFNNIAYIDASNCTEIRAFRVLENPLTTLIFGADHLDAEIINAGKTLLTSVTIPDNCFDASLNTFRMDSNLFPDAALDYILNSLATSGPAGWGTIDLSDNPGTRTTASDAAVASISSTIIL